jgi:hypothetical protein
MYKDFDSCVRDYLGPVGFVFVGVWCDDGRITPELRTLEEIEAHERSLQASLSAAFEKLKREFVELQRKPRAPLFPKG